MIDKLTQQTLKFATGFKGIVIMAIVSFTEAVFFVIPPDPFLGLLCIKQSYKKVLNLTLICLAASIFGGCIAYFLGDEIVQYSIANNITPITKNLDKLDLIKEKINEDTFLLMILSGFTPLPFKIFCIGAGILNASFIPFLIGSIIGRFLRFALVGYLAKEFGEKFMNILKSKKVLYPTIALMGILVIYFIYKWN
ncbi:MAG: VTT domain-containing protein [Thermodesulfobacteriota bacterium]|nr:VTT domain-containing protein [Thermodesulfobacteriota bacterium]|tara:strand:+ start:1300 stop:1884 length:585 start_codon:yes stop_codon:yes gene_type:complete